MNIRRGNFIIVALLSIVMIYFGGGIAITKCCHDKIVYSVDDDCCRHEGKNKHGLDEKSCMNVVVIHLSPTTSVKQAGKTIPQVYVINVPDFLHTLFFTHIPDSNVLGRWSKPTPNAPPKALLSLICTFII
ncbi:MAG: hypothetical protein ACI4V5_01230 [Prevotella sp.]